MRKVIFHYHLFKNAGTSLDAALKKAFNKQEWVTAEFPSHQQKNREQVAEWVQSKSDAICFSSHTAFMKPGKIAGVEVFPVVFVRHPVDRIQSAYLFEKEQNAKTFGSTLARNTSFSGYVETMLAMPGWRQVRNFHAWRLAMSVSPKEGVESERALIAVNRLPFIGVVDQYGQSLTKLNKALAIEGFGDVHLKILKKNVSSGQGSDLTSRLSDIKNQLGESLYNELVEANSVDMEIYKKVKDRYHTDD